MYARVVLGATKSVPFREVSSIQGCPYRGVPLYMTGYLAKMQPFLSLRWSTALQILAVATLSTYQHAQV